jgi:sugar (pentulose or hexulose) kinase
LPSGIAVCVGLGDNQASFFGSVSDPDNAILVNVGTGGQVAAYSRQFLYAAGLETRPFPGGYLLVSAGLCGGRAYALLERFFRQLAEFRGEGGPAKEVFEMMNRLAADIPRGANGLRCLPLFTGTRQNPQLRGSFTGISAENFTPAHMTRALLEGMVDVFAEGRREIEAALGKQRSQLVGAGNALRENSVLIEILSEKFGVPLEVPVHREEAAFGAALLAAVGLGVLPDRGSAQKLIRHQRCQPA